MGNRASLGMAVALETSSSSQVDSAVSLLEAYLESLTSFSLGQEWSLLSIIERVFLAWRERGWQIWGGRGAVMKAPGPLQQSL